MRPLAQVKFLSSSHSRRKQCFGCEIDSISRSLFPPQVKGKLLREPSRPCRQFAAVEDVKSKLVLRVKQVRYLCFDASHITTIIIIVVIIIIIIISHSMEVI